MIFITGWKRNYPYLSAAVVILFLLSITLAGAVTGARPVSAAPPSVSAGPDLYAVVNEKFLLNGSASIDATTYWRTVDAPGGRDWAVKILYPGRLDQQIKITRTGVFSLELMAARDGERRSDRVTITVVSSPGAIPTGIQANQSTNSDSGSGSVDAGPDLQAVVDTKFQLDGTVPAGATARWITVSATGGRDWAVKILEPNRVDQSIKVTRPGSYTLELLASYNGTTTSDRVNLTIVDSASQLPQTGDKEPATTSSSTTATSSTSTSSGGSGAVPVILDTDFGGDVDDVGAVAVLNALHNRGEARMLAVMSVSWKQHSVAGISVINNFYGNRHVPIGRHSYSSRDTSNGYAKFLANRYRHNITYQNAPNSTSLYRRILAGQPDNSVVVITIGQLRNIQAVLRSSADGISPLNGRDLFNRKVRRLHIMGGRYPNSGSPGEANFAQSGTGTAQYVIENVRKPIIFNGFEIGNRGAGYSTGSRLDRLPLSNPVAGGYHYFFEIDPPNYVNGGRPYNAIQDWSIWDQIAILHAIREDSTYFGMVSRGFNDVSSRGVNVWRPSPDLSHSYLVRRMDPQTLADSIVEPLMMR